MLDRYHAADNRNRGTDPPPIRQLLRPWPVDDAKRTAVTDGKDAYVFCHPTGACGVRNQPGRGIQPEYLAHRPPSGAAHCDDDRRAQKTNKRAQVPFGASVDPARQNGPGHRPFLDAEDRVRQEHRSLDVALGWMPYLNSRCRQQPMQIDVGLVVGFVAPAIADEITDIAKILANDQQLGLAVAEPLFPKAHHDGSNGNSVQLLPRRRRLFRL